MDRITGLLKSKRVRVGGLLALTLLYLAGVVCLFFNTQLGVLLWCAALIPSIVIFIVQKRNERQRALERARDESVDGERAKE